MPQSATIIAPNESALSRKHGPTPSSAITAPAAAGPTIRALWTITELSATALTVRSGPTSSVTKLWRAGLSSALTAPRANTSANTIQTSTWPPIVSAHSVSAGSAIERLRDHEQLALAHAVGEHAAHRAEDEDRQELQRRGQADGGAGAGELHDQPHLGHGLHPVARERDHLAGEVAPVVRDAEGEEGAVQGGAHLLAALQGEDPLIPWRRSRVVGGSSRACARGSRRRAPAPRGRRRPARRCAGRGRRPCGRGRSPAARGPRPRRSRASSGGPAGRRRGRPARPPRAARARA